MTDYRFNKDRMAIVAMIENELTDTPAININAISYRALRNFGMSERQVAKIVEAGTKSGRWEQDETTIYKRGYRGHGTES